jgi:branched-chain amino acid transport system ATP-binding protein
VASEVTVRFGGLFALREASFSVRTGQIAGLIGPNGAGKTTLFNCLTGLYRVNVGSIRYRGEELRGMRPHSIAELGVSRTFQNLALFGGLSVRENVLVGLHRKRRTGWFSSALRTRPARAEARESEERVDEILAEFSLLDRADDSVGNLPYGTLKRVEIARALIARPDLLLLDEPATGLAHGEVEELMALIRQLRMSRDLTVVVVEHNMGLVMRLCDNVTVLNSGMTIASGAPADVAQDSQVIAAYLGGHDVAA